MPGLPPFSAEAPTQVESGQTETRPDMQHILDNALEIANRLEAIYAQLHRLVHGTPPISAVPQSET
ncbi:hypothetical protein [Ensifer sp. LCM 4579]|uniref:hypothetical protein n=1 Tax=Ensifer sp. LCM 4579 TaxID=1848292 RepID=UPI0008DA3937|nr:hypothetical protein [Ensifer sp. LCM 4579]OHV72561.1 hypothetical protein LCM4579_10615 [Ensifer sp. LCM 4579]